MQRYCSAFQSALRKRNLHAAGSFIDEEVAVLPGLDGRKMSKSYDNVIPLFEGGEKALKAAILKVVTDCKEPGEPKDPCSTSLTQLYDAFATPTEKKSLLIN